MKKKVPGIVKIIVPMIVALAVIVVLVSQLFGGNAIDLARLEDSGVLSVLRRTNDDSAYLLEYGYFAHDRLEVSAEEKGIQKVYYVVELYAPKDEETHFSVRSAKYYGIGKDDERFLKTGTVVFCFFNYPEQNREKYSLSGGGTCYGYREKAILYCYDLDADELYIAETFWGDKLPKKRVSVGSADFTNRVSRSEIDKYLKGLVR